MSVMTMGTSEPQQRPLTVEDLERMPDDGRRYELVGGRLDVSPAPVFVHSLVEGRLLYHLMTAAPKGHIVLPGAGINLNDAGTHHRIPDLLVTRKADVEKPYLTRPPLLAVEVLSPESVFRDNHTKRAEYAEFGIGSYWIFNPSTEKPGLLELRLTDGEYREVTQVFGEEVFATDAPFPMKVVPQHLVDEALDDWMESVGDN
ncbi:Uma2 family endonuclease [Nocardiopsis gilva]|nr:Uma2 family endonuclease [Nocardiopsis gilva]